MELYFNSILIGPGNAGRRRLLKVKPKHRTPFRSPPCTLDFLDTAGRTLSISRMSNYNQIDSVISPMTPPESVWSVILGDVLMSIFICLQDGRPCSSLEAARAPERLASSAKSSLLQTQAAYPIISHGLWLYSHWRTLPLPLHHMPRVSANGNLGCIRPNDIPRFWLVAQPGHNWRFIPANEISWYWRL